MSGEMELKVCPFCGGEGRIDQSTQSTLSWPVWEHSSKCPMQAAQLYNSPEEALKAGNARTPTPTAVSVEAVARALCKVTRADPDALGVDGKPRWRGWKQFAEAAIAAINEAQT